MSEAIKNWIAARCDVKAMGHTSPCWVWRYYLTEKGYARAGLPTAFGFGPKRYRVHRISYEAHVGPIPEGLDIDHLCRVKACQNPDHLEPVTNSENARRTIGFKRRPHCSNGHAFTAENTALESRGRRKCRICKNQYQRRWQGEARRIRSQNAAR